MGKSVGAKRTNGYLGVCVDYKVYLAHRIIWQMVYGDVPANMQIDHINGNKADNRIANLRLVTHQQNNMNRPLQSNNKSGQHGVFWNNGRAKWQSRIIVSRKQIHLGFFKSQKDAVKAREQAEKSYGFSSGHGRQMLATHG